MLIELAEVRRSRPRSVRSLEGLLDQALAVVEASLHLQGVHVAAEGRELLLLQLAHPARTGRGSPRRCSPGRGRRAPRRFPCRPRWPRGSGCAALSSPRKSSMAAARNWAPKSLKAHVGPWKSSRRRRCSSRRRRTGEKVKARSAIRRARSPSSSGASRSGAHAPRRAAGRGWSRRSAAKRAAEVRGFRRGGTARRPARGR